ncbi:MAG: LysR family transcriptional regulator [Acidimicrobiaceae bacterium]|nr:LysR family transcriptional regulator [Acidimicrobiaceae bacterium]
MPLLEPVIDIRSLDLLNSVDECGSIAQAAKRHRMSQPAASMRLRGLEDALGLRLLDRSHGRAMLSAEGVAVVKWGAGVLESARLLHLSAQALRTKGKNQLRVVASMTVAEYLVPGWLSRMQTLEPSVVVSLEMGNSQHVLEVMLDGGAEIGFVEGQNAPRELSSRIVQSDELVIVVAPTHPWVKRRKPVSPLEVAKTPLVVRESGSGTREVLEAAMRVLGLEVRPFIELGSTTAIKAAVSSGSAPGVLSWLAVADDVRDGRLIVVKTGVSSLERSIRAVWSKQRPLAPSAKRLLRQLG